MATCSHGTLIWIPSGDNIACINLVNEGNVEIIFDIETNV